MGELLHAVIRLRYRSRVERIGTDEVGARVEIFAVNRLDHAGLRDRQEIVVAAQIPGPVREPAAAEVGLAQLMALDHGAHGAIENDESFPEQRQEGGGTFALRLRRVHGRG